MTPEMLARLARLDQAMAACVELADGLVDDARQALAGGADAGALTAEMTLGALTAGCTREELALALSVLAMREAQRQVTS